MAEKRVFSEAEISEIFMRAAKMQEEAPTEDAVYAPGFTRDELLRMATELGLDHEFIEAAIRQQGNSVVEKKGRTILGVPFGTEVEHIIEGEVPTDRYDLLAEVVGGSPTMRGPGVRQLGKSLTGPFHAGVASGTFTITPRDGRTRVRFRHSPLIAYFMTMHWIALLCLVAFPVSIGEGSIPVIPGLIAMFTCLALGWLAFGALARNGVEKTRARAAEVAERLQDEVDALRENLAKPTVSATGQAETQGEDQRT